LPPLPSRLDFGHQVRAAFIFTMAWGEALDDGVGVMFVSGEIGRNRSGRIRWLMVVTRGVDDQRMRQKLVNPIESL
jgi:hypothetical protein